MQAPPELRREVSPVLLLLGSGIVSAHFYLSCLHPSSVSTPLTAMLDFFSLM